MPNQRKGEVWLSKYKVSSLLEGVDIASAECPAAWKNGGRKCVNFSNSDLPIKIAKVHLFPPTQKLPNSLKYIENESVVIM